MQACITDQFGADTPVPLFSNTFESASGFMNFCENLAILSSQPVDQQTWPAFVNDLLTMVRRDISFDLVAPATLALSRRCSVAGPQTTIGPAPGLAGDTSIGVKMIFA